MVSPRSARPSRGPEEGTALGLRVLPGGRSPVGTGTGADPDRSSPPFVGRAHQCLLLRQLLAGGRADRAPAALVTGETGVGKTALLEHLTTTTPARPLWVRGVESEAALPFAAVADLLLPLWQHLDLVPDPQREALEAALGRCGGPVTSPLSVCAATLAVLEAAGAQQRLLVLVDDLQWVDPESRQILLFVARRLTGDGVAMAMAARDRPGPEMPATGVATLRLEGLSLAESRELVAGLGIEVSTAVLEELVGQTGGNPLAVVETVRAERPAVLAGSGLDFAGPRVGPVLRRVWASALDTLPLGTRTALLVVAASRSTRPGDLEPVLAALGLSLAELDPAERAGLLDPHPSGVRLRSPLARVAVLECLPLATRRLVLRTLAEHARIEPCYLAGCLGGPDDAVADELAAAAARARADGEYAVSSRTWARAAELTADGAARARRLLAAAADAHLAGVSAPVQSWCEEALALRSDPRFTAEVELVRGRARSRLGQPTRAVDDLVRAADGLAPHDPGGAALLYAEAALPCAMAGRFDEMLTLTARSEQAQDPGTARPGATVVMRAAALALAGRTDHARRCLDALGATTADPARDWDLAVWDLQHLAVLGLVRVWTEDLDEARIAFGSVLSAALRAKAPSMLPPALVGRCELDWWTGHWSAAYSDGLDALARATALRQSAATANALLGLARIDAVCGDGVRCEERVRLAARTAGSSGMDGLCVSLAAVLGLQALGAADHLVAARHLDHAWRVARARGLGNTNVVPFSGDLVEAHVRSGDGARARAVLAWLDERAAATQLVYPAAAAARYHGLLADDPESAGEYFRRAAALHDKVDMPFERARTLLCEGETLRRLRRPGAARPPLLEARMVFDTLGARPWAARAEAGLAATGAGVRAQAVPEDGQPGLDTLTPQELQVARSVAGGLNNGEVAMALFVSRKTVEAHLTRIYRKLGVRSRTGLARLMPPCQQPPAPRRPTAAAPGERHP